MNKSKNTFTQKQDSIKRKWIIIDASSAPLGRVSVTISKYLVGKYKPTYTPHIDNGDHVIVINAKKLVVTGDKETTKTYYRHSGYPGGIKSATLSEVRAKSPEKLITEAVKGMIPKNKLAADRLKRLRVFAGETHTHEAQSPQKVEVK